MPILTLRPLLLFGGFHDDVVLSLDVTCGCGSSEGAVGPQSGGSVVVVLHTLRGPGHQVHNPAAVGTRTADGAAGKKILDIDHRREKFVPTIIHRCSANKRKRREKAFLAPLSRSPVQRVGVGGEWHAQGQRRRDGPVSRSGIFGVRHRGRLAVGTHESVDAANGARRRSDLGAVAVIRLHAESGERQKNPSSSFGIIRTFHFVTL